MKDCKPQNIKDFFTKRRRTILSVSAIEREADVPQKTLDKFLAERRGLPKKHIYKIVDVLKDFGF